jgi:hypothetical protein
MHKSGTTLISQILHHSGINMGENIDAQIHYDQGNKYERGSTLALDVEILGLKDESDPVIDLEPPDTLQMTEAQRARMREIIRTCNQAYTDWGFKDPRASLVYPLWAQELPEHKIVAIYRSPGEIWPRFRYKHLHYYYRNPSRAWKVLKRWCEHNISILTNLQHTQADFIVLNYREFMTDDAEFDRLQKFVGIKLNDQRKKGLYRNRSEEYPLINIATWLIQQQTGHSPDKIIEQLEALRPRQQPRQSTFEST